MNEPLYTTPPAAQPASVQEREAFLAGYEAAQADAKVCHLPPHGWRCTRTAGHDGPCAAVESPEDIELVASAMSRLREAAAPVQEVDWKDMYEKEKRRSEMWVAKYEKDIGPLEKAAPAAQPKD